MNDNKPTNNELLNKGVSLPDVKATLMRGAVPFAPEQILSDLQKAMDKSKNAKNKKEREIAEKEEHALFQKAIPLLNFEKHYLPLDITDNESHRTFLIDFSNQLIEEYKCDTPSEKSLVHMIATSYIRVLEYSQRLHYSVKNAQFLSQEKNGFYNILSKEIDKAHRQFTGAMTLLKQAKSPNIKVNITSENTLIAQNQQLNINNGESGTHENNTPK